MENEGPADPAQQPIDRTGKKEIVISKPTAFTGDRTRVRRFIQECHGYLHLNRHVYTDDESKIAFVLALLNDKEAAKWKETYMVNIINEAGAVHYPTYQEFLEKFTSHFRPINQAMVANTNLLTLRQGRKSVEEYVSEFRLLASLAGMDSDSASDNLHLINYFRRGLLPAISKKIALSDNIPLTIMGWTDRAIQYDTNYQLEMDMRKGFNDYQKPSSSSSNYKKEKKERDPFAMDIDGMSSEKRAYMMKKGLCFKCEKPGHRSRDCEEEDDKKKDKGKKPFKKRNVREIHALLQTLSKNEMAELLSLGKEGEEKKEEAEESDF